MFPLPTKKEVDNSQFDESVGLLPVSNNFLAGYATGFKKILDIGISL
jgi:uncharacterized membrane protein (Fun14 family)